MKKHISAVLLSLTACSQSVEVDEAGSNHSDAIATGDSTTAMNAGDASADGTSRTTDSAMDVSPSESDAMISQSDASAPDSDTGPLACAPGTANCNMDDTDGCETSLDTVSNCGACNPGWRDLDGNRANGCETAAPSQIPNLRVWLSVQEPGSLVMSDCGVGSSQWCISRWNNLANPAIHGLHRRRSREHPLSTRM